MGAQGSLRSFAGGHDNLLIFHIGDIAGGEHTRHAGRRLAVDNDLAVLVDLKSVHGEGRIGKQADFNKNSVDFQSLFRTV